MEFFAQNLRYLMKKTNLVQGALALVSGRGQTTIANWTNGRTQPKYTTLITICDYFGLTVAEILTTDLEKSNIVTEEFIAAFDARNPHKAKRKKRYSHSDGAENFVLEKGAQGVLGGKMGKTINRKLDRIIDLLESQQGS